MDEIADLIRLLAEAPAEEAPMTRPKEMLDRIAMERAVTQGLTPEGQAVPSALAKPSEIVFGMPTNIAQSPMESINAEDPVPMVPQFGAAAEPRNSVTEYGSAAVPQEVISRSAAAATPRESIPQAEAAAIPREPVSQSGAMAGLKEFTSGSAATAAPREPAFQSGAMAGLKEFVAQSGGTAAPREAVPQFGATADPKTAVPNIPVDVKVYSPETFMGRAATPYILDAIAGLPARFKQSEDTIGVAQVTPRSEVTISVPPAFPIDPKEAFSMVDEQLDLPPRQEELPRREIPADTTDLHLESTEAFVARSFQALEGARSDLDRWSL